MTLKQLWVFFVNHKSKMLAHKRQRLTFEPLRKCLNL
jgi:hypothetical protein